MRLATIEQGSGTVAARVEGEFLTILPFEDVGALLGDGPGWREAASADRGEQVAVSEARLAPVVPHPEKIICIGLNYAAHVKETGNDPPRYPSMFAKYWRSLIGADADVQLSREVEHPDWEAELCVVVGAHLRHADAEAARAAIAGYTVINDVSMRDWQRRSRQWLQGKTFEASTPVGPHLVTLDELEDPEDLRVVCRVDGETVQDGRTSDLIFSVPELLSYISRILTLAPGDMIATGTPSGVGWARDPRRKLEPGQLLETEVEGVGLLKNRCVRES